MLQSFCFLTDNLTFPVNQAEPLFKNKTKEQRNSPSVLLSVLVKVFVCLCELTFCRCDCKLVRNSLLLTVGQESQGMHVTFCKGTPVRQRSVFSIQQRGPKSQITHPYHRISNVLKSHLYFLFSAGVHAIHLQQRQHEQIHQRCFSCQVMNE